MKIAVMGAGGVGGYYGAVLAKAGEDVTFIARGAHLLAMQKNGLKVESQASGDFALPKVRATNTPGDIGPVDFILMATKTFDLESASASLKPCLGPNTMILPLLNGVDIADRIAAVVGKEHVLGGMCQISAMIKEPGTVRQVGPLNRIVFGELAGGKSKRVENALATMKNAGMTVDLSEQVLVDLWNKFMLICAVGGVCAVTNSVLGPWKQDPDTRGLFLGVMEEVQALATKLGVPMKPDQVQTTMASIDKLPDGMRPSLLLSLEQGAKLELDAMNGQAARLGKQHGVPMPTNQFIFAALKPKAEGKKA